MLFSSLIFGFLHLTSFILGHYSASYFYPSSFYPSIPFLSQHPFLIEHPQFTLTSFFDFTIEHFLLIHPFLGLFYFPSSPLLHPFILSFHSIHNIAIPLFIIFGFRHLFVSFSLSISSTVLYGAILPIFFPSASPRTPSHSIPFPSFPSYVDQFPSYN